MSKKILNQTRAGDREETGKKRYFALRDAGKSREFAATVAGISASYAQTLDAQSADCPDRSFPHADRDDAYVAALVALGGLPRFSEKWIREGHVACMPLIPFQVRP